MRFLCMTCRALTPRLAAAMLLAALALPALSESTLVGDLPRRAEVGFRVATQGNTLTVRSVEPDSAAGAAGLAAGDVILAVNGQAFARPFVGSDLLRRMRGGSESVITISRGSERRDIRFTPPAAELEQLDGVDTEHGVLRLADGTRLRTLVTRPADRVGPLPAIFFVQWVSCDSVELTRPGAWLDVLRGVAQRSGAMMIRIERSAGGDSEGPGCHELDFDTELAVYRQAFDTLVRPPLVDIDRVVIWGNSLGGMMVPLVAEGRAVAGLITGGGGALTYFERMLAFDRIGFERSGLSPGEIDERMRRHAEFHVEYLLRGRTPEQITSERPHLADVWGNIRGAADGVHYGRPYAYHHQAAGKDFLGAWTASRAPVLVLYSQYDQFETLHGHRIIAEMRERHRVGPTRFVELPQMGHSYEVYHSADDAAAWRRPTPAPELAIGAILEWLGNIVGVRPST